MNRIKKLARKIKSVDYGNAFKTFLPYLIAVLSGVTTYFLYSYFNRDIVRVQSVSVRPKEIVLTNDRPLANKLTKLLFASSLERAQNGPLDLSKINKDYIIESIKTLQKRSLDLNDDMQLCANAKSKLNELVGDSLSKDDIIKINVINDLLNDDFVFSRSYSDEKKKKSRQDLIKIANDRFNYYQKNKLDVDSTVQKLVQKSKKAIDDNRANFLVEVIAFNDGNQQTVIRNKGILTLGQNQINLKRASFIKIEDYYSKLSKAIAGKYNQDGPNSNYIIIEPKSFIVMNLEVDDFNNKNRDIEVIKREYLSGQSLVDLTLFDIKNTPIKQYSFLLQNDIEVDPNDEISKYVIQYVNK